MASHSGPSEHLPAFLAAIDLQQYSSASQILAVKELAYTGALYSTVTSQTLDSTLQISKATVGRLALYIDCSALESTQEIVDVLDAGAAKVFVTSQQVPEMQKVPNIDSKRIVYHPTVSADQAESQLDGTGYGLYLQNVQDVGTVSKLVDAMGKERPTVYAAKSGMSESEAVELRRRDVVPVLPATHLTTDDAQSGNGKIRVAELLLADIQTDRPDGLFTTLVTDERGVALGLVYSNPESIAASLSSARGVYWSRKRGLWRKGDTSGDWQELVRIDTDCDNDCLRFVVRQQGAGFCHLSTATCFGDYNGLSKLERTLQSRKRSAPEGSYTKRLFEDSKMLNAKIMEEAQELCEAGSKEDIAAEAADVLYFALTKAVAAGVSLEDIERNLDGKSVKVKRRKGDAKGVFAEKFGVVNGGANGTAAAASTNGGLTRKEVREAESRQKRKDDPAGTNGEGRIQMRRIVTAEEKPEVILEALQRPSQRSTEKIMAIVQPIIKDVREGGDKALLSYTHKFEKATSLTSPVLKAPFPESMMQLPQETIEAIDISFENIRKFHAAQAETKTLEVETMPGVVCSRFSRPIERVGLYVPGGTAVLPSTALMLGVPAMVAGCKKIVMASPPRADGKLTPEVVYVAHKVGAESIVLAGGAQAVAAMAYGTENVSKVDKILGPGNQFVTAAKMLVSNDTTAQVSIDMPAGPSEVLVIADATSNPAFVASDLLSQAEHGTDSQVVCITVGCSAEQIRGIEDELHKQAMALPRVEMVKGAISHSVLLVTATLEEAMDLSNAYAPEHLILHLASPISARDLVTNAGSVFCGQWTPESVGDYSAGVNHSLPTYGYAKQYSGVNLGSYVKFITSSHLTEQGLRNVGPAVMRLAQVEELEAHRRAVEMRLGVLDRRDGVGKSA
ncbi:trifunctional histidinol dehydrogenase [Recurvomyces mirabilis]|nr:trifunctional histidinol dehydrogenase [Recurvomyces mirabilis]